MMVFQKDTTRESVHLELPPAPPNDSPPPCFSREEIVRRELRHFARNALRRELRDFGEILKSDLKSDLESSISELLRNDLRSDLEHSISEEVERAVSGLARPPTVEAKPKKTDRLPPGCSGSLSLCIPEALRNTAHDGTASRSGSLCSSDRSQTSSPGPQCRSSLKCQTTPARASELARRLRLPPLDDEDMPRRMVRTISCDDHRASSDEEGTLQKMSSGMSPSPSSSSSWWRPGADSGRKAFSSGSFDEEEDLEGATLPGVVSAQSVRSKPSMVSKTSKRSRTATLDVPPLLDVGKRSSKRQNSSKQTPFGKVPSMELPVFLGFRRTPSKDRRMGKTRSEEATDLESPQSAMSPQSPSASLATSAAETAGHCRGIMEAMVLSARFDWAVGFLVLLQGLLVGIQTDHIARESTDHVPAAYRAVDITFCILFNTELTLRVLTFGRYFFIGEDWRWNFFDIGVVILQNFEEITTLLAEAISEEGSSSAGSSFGYLRLLRLVRLVRFLRIVRFVRYVSELRKLVCSIGSSLQSLAWTVVLLIYILYVASVCFTQIVANHVGGDAASEPELRRYFGSLGMSFLSLFQAISGGVDWENLCRPLLEVHLLAVVLFVAYIAFAVLAMMNVVTGVFVDSALQSSQKDQEHELILRMREFNHKTNLDNGGSITWAEFEHCLQQQDSMDYFKSIGLNIAEAKSLFELLDVRDTGVVDSDEFVMGCLRMKGPARSVDLTTLMYDNKRMLWKLQTTSEMAINLLQDTLDAKSGRAKHEST